MPIVHIRAYNWKPCPLPNYQESALSVHNLSATYEYMQVLHNINFKIAAGNRVALVGANGAGKSTLLKVIMGLLKATQGEVRIFGLMGKSCPHCLAYLPQRSQIDWRFPVNVHRLVMAGRYVHLGWFKRPRKHDHTLVMKALAALELSDLATRQISHLSGGQQQRALLARALVQDADILLLDEPLNAVDQHTREIMAQVLDDIRAKGKTVIMATHDVDRLESDFDDVIYLADGKQVQPEEVFSHHPSSHHSFSSNASGNGRGTHA